MEPKSFQVDLTALRPGGAAWLSAAKTGLGGGGSGSREGWVPPGPQVGVDVTHLGLGEQVIWEMSLATLAAAGGLSLPPV